MVMERRLGEFEEALSAGEGRTRCWVNKEGEGEVRPVRCKERRRGNEVGREGNQSSGVSPVERRKGMNTPGNS